MNRKIFYNDQVFRSPSLPGDPGDLPGLQPPGVRLGTYQAQLSQEPTDRAEYYAVRPRRSREAYKKQYDRSASAMPEHYRLVEEVLAEQPEGIVQRVNVKLSSPQIIYHFSIDFLELAVSCLGLGEGGCDCTALAMH